MPPFIFGTALIGPNRRPFRELPLQDREERFPTACGWIMTKHIEDTGFAAPHDHKLGDERRTVVLAQLVAAAGLAFATIVAATAVSVGFAHADLAGNVIDNEGSLTVVSLLLGLLFIGMGGLTVLTMPHRQHPPKATKPARHHGHFA
jgi:hypothetical protein